MVSLVSKNFGCRAISPVTVAPVNCVAALLIPETTDAEAPGSIYDLGPEVEGPLALVLGAEGKGLAPLTKKRCAVLASIPRHGRLDSLNVATAGAVAIFEMGRRRA